MPQQIPPIEPGTLARRLQTRIASALADGSLEPIATQESRVQDAGCCFLVRQVDSIARKQAAARKASPADPKRPANPFLPPEPGLTVGGIGANHVAVLNKFNVLASHLLVVTRDFEDQETLLGPADFEAVAFCLSEIDGLVFYNGGRVAGASQPHKHLQLVPLPLAEDGPAVPIERLLLASPASGDEAPLFRHALAGLESGSLDAGRLHSTYLGLLAWIGVASVVREDGAAWQSAPYNLLATRRWMMAVPRLVEHVDGISINALGFAGSLFVKDAEQLTTIRRRGPMAVLCEAAGWA